MILDERSKSPVITTISTILALLLACASCAADTNTEPDNTSDTEIARILVDNVPDELVSDAERNCAVDADCALVDSGCCPCANSGALMAVNTTSVSAIEARREPLCDGFGCFTVPSADPSCCADAICLEGRCEVFGLDNRSVIDNCIPH